ncbi:hypothetical protein J6590_010594 [Homalodisca vitripennis]|nr:hypothetical protein J6590_010594 [Homalodisca vitripennis]
MHIERGGEATLIDAQRVHCSASWETIEGADTWRCMQAETTRVRNVPPGYTTLSMHTVGGVEVVGWTRPAVGEAVTYHGLRGPRARAEARPCNGTNLSFTTASWYPLLSPPCYCYFGMQICNNLTTHTKCK